jgi:phenylalanyl-tRNA synthetase beta chain
MKIQAKSETVTRFYSCVLSDISVHDSPDWMQQRLRDFGMEPINNIVDVTNYVMIETGMPLHAFDKKRLSGNHLILRAAQKGEVCETFDGGSIELTPEDVIFAGPDKQVYGLVGIVGGKGSGVHEDTTEILLECAGYKREVIRKTMMRHAIHTEAGLRHSHDLHDSLCDYALERAASLLQEIASKKKPRVSQVQDYHPHPDTPVQIAYDPQEVTRLCGVDIPVDEQITIMKRLQISVETSGKNKNSLIVTPPLFRTDLTLSEDIVEEVVRIWGYEKIPPCTLSSEIPAPITPPEVSLEEHSRDVFTAAGMDEMVTVPFVEKSLFKKVGDPKAAQAIGVINPPTSNHTHLRTHLMYEHLDIASRKISRGDEHVSFFEIGKVYEKKQTNFHQPPHAKDFPYAEYAVIGGVFVKTDDQKDYFTLKGILEAYFAQLRLSDVSFEKQTSFPYAVSAAITQRNRFLGSVGVVSPSISHRVFNIKQPVYMFSLSVEELVAAETTPYTFLPYSQYPPITMDLSLDIPRVRSVGEIIRFIKQQRNDIIRSVAICDVYEQDITRSVLVRITYQSKTKTLEQAQVQKVHQDIAQRVTEKCNVQIRGLKT